MRERGDCTCFHEPFMYDYYVHRAVRTMPLFDLEPHRPQSYGDIRDMLLAAAADQTVFIKDMSYYVVPALFHDAGFAQQITHCFLVRDPMKSIVSYHKLDPDLSCEEIGIEAQWRHFDWLQTQLGITAPVVRAEDLQRDPIGIVGTLWQRLGLVHRREAFSWEDDEAPEDWGQVAGWHNQVSGSQGICKPADEAAEERRKTFDRAAKNAPQLNAFLEHHQPYYDRLCEHALTAG